MSRRGCGFFIAGTDTSCGKTRVTVGLLRALRGLGIAAIAGGVIAFSPRSSANTGLPSAMLASVFQ